MKLLILDSDSIYTLALIHS